MIALFILLITVLLILSIWNHLIFRKMKSVKEDEIKDARFWELNYKMDYLVAVAAMGAAVLVFLGYESLQSAKEAAKSEIDKELIMIREDLTEAQAKNQSLKLSSDSIKDNVAFTGTQIDSQIKALNELSIKIKLINSRSIVQQGFYVVRGLKLPFDHESKPGSNKIYFKNLITDKGGKLPEFSNPPLVIPISQSNWEMNIFNIKQDSFEAYWGGATINAVFPETLEYSVVIIGEVKTFDESLDNSFK
ncbi:MAG: hypothetical protein KF763_11130 [Cyclobacteriaceae bacterium]|nr:hypothetical protein [Cyclobacteriaceae bacterium]